jgi:lipooligosaccharide transport system permease protein
VSALAVGIGRSLGRLGGARVVVERNVLVNRRTWMVIFSGFFEPLLYLFSLGFGLRGFVGHIDVGGGRTIDYASFIAPGLLAAAAMNGPVYETGNIFWKLRYARVYETVVATPVEARDIALGESAWTLFRGLLYSVGFLIVAAALGLVHSWWGALALPASFLAGFAFAGVALAAATFMRSWQDFEILQLVTLPLFLFSATFYPLSAYPRWLQWAIEVTPLYRAVSLLRSLTTGAVGWALLVDLAYLAVMGALGVWFGGRRLRRILLA